MTEERLEKLYWELDELESNPYLLDWSADDIKRLNITKLNIWGIIYKNFHSGEKLSTGCQTSILRIIYKNFHSGEKPEKVIRDMIARRIKE